MSNDMEQLYAERLKRYTTAMRNEKPDKVPIRPFAAEFTARYAGYTDQEVTQDYEKAFAAARKNGAPVRTEPSRWKRLGRERALR